MYQVIVVDMMYFLILFLYSANFFSCHVTYSKLLFIDYYVNFRLVNLLILEILCNNYIDKEAWKSIIEYQNKYIQNQHKLKSILREVRHFSVLFTQWQIL